MRVMTEKLIDLVTRHCGERGDDHLHNDNRLTGAFII